MPKHTVKQGEHLARIAAEAGFSNFKKIWEAPDNKDLHDQRDVPGVLMPGDRVTLPDLEKKSVDAQATEARHKFRFEATPVKLKIRIHDETDKPVKGAPVKLEVEGDAQNSKTDGDGLVSREIPPKSHDGTLIMRTPDAPFDLEVNLQVGDLNPIDTVTGQIARLNNLGYFAGEVQEPGDDDAKLQFRSAVEEFQCNKGLKVDGTCGPKTQDTLKKEHGC